jgi:hypothetical protein
VSKSLLPDPHTRILDLMTKMVNGWLNVWMQMWTVNLKITIVAWILTDSYVPYVPIALSELAPPPA